MDWYKPICAHFITPLWARWERSDYLRHIDDLTAFQYLSRDEIEIKQWQKTKAILNHAYDNCPYYAKLFKSRRVHPNDIRSWTDFEKIPLLTKNEIRNHYRDIIARNIDQKMFHAGMTSGSTGKPLHFVADEKGLQWTRAHIALTDGWAGWKIGERRFAVSGIHANQSNHTIKEYLRKKLLNRTILLNTLELDEDSMWAFYRRLRAVQRPFIYGFAHAIYLFALYLRKINVTNLYACGIVTGGMVLKENERSVIEQIFHCTVLNRYGTEECGVVACECENQEGLHVSVGKYYIEIINSDKKTGPGEMGSLIITDLMNYGMPFIRYQIEDMAIASESACSCGRTWPLIKEIAGRTSDFIITPEKKVVSGISLTDFFAAIPGIIQVQIIQDNIDHIVFKIVTSRDYTNESVRQLKMIEHRFFGESMQVDYDYVDNIQLGLRGKFCFVKSKIAHEYFNITS